MATLDSDASMQSPSKVIGSEAMDVDDVEGLINTKATADASSSPARKHEVTHDDPPFWIEIPRLSTPERAQYQYAPMEVDDEEPLEVVYELRRDGEVSYYARMRSGLYKKVTPYL